MISGMKMIFLHGFPDNSRTWDHLVAHFQNHSPCHAPDIHSLTLAQQVALIGELAAGGPVVLIAHDMGGPAAVEFAQTHQQQVAHLVLLNSMGLDMFAHRLRSLDQLLKSSYMTIFSNPFVTTKTLKRFTGKLLNFVYDRGGLAASDPLRQNTAEVFDGLRLYKELGWELPKRLFDPAGIVYTPTTFVFGEHDPFLLPPTQTELNRFFDRAEIRTLPAGHWPQRTHALELCQLLDQVLGKIKE